jgi:hypothetical protein
VCEHLGVAPTSLARQRPSALSNEQVGVVNEWIATCELAWICCDSDQEAKVLERALLDEAMPPLSKR